RRRNVILDLAGFRAADANAALAARVVGVLARRVLRFRIGDVKDIVPVDENSARPSELFPCGEELSVLIEDRDAAVAAVGNEQPTLRIERQHVRAFQLAIAGDQMAAILDELAVLVEFYDARIAEARRVAFGDENVAVRGKGDSGRP